MGMRLGGLSGTESEMEDLSDFQGVRHSDLQRPRRFRVVRSVPLPWVIEAKHSCGATQVRTDRSPHPAPRLAESHQNLI